MSHASPAARPLLLLALLTLAGCAGTRATFTPEASGVRVAVADVMAGENLFPIVEAGRWGFMNRQGQVVIAPRFQFAAPFSEGLAAVKQDNLWGYLAPDGTWAIEPQFESASGFSDGRGLVGMGREADRLFGFVDPSGALVVPIVLPYALSYSEGLALVRLTETEPTAVEAFLASLRGNPSAYGYAFLDRDGQVVFEVPGISAASFAEGLAPFEESRGLVRSTTWGYLDREGEIVVPANLDGPAFRHTDGLARVGRDGEIGFVNRDGAFVIEPTYGLAFSFSEGLAPVRVDGVWGFIDASGEIAIAPAFRSALPFASGLAPVQTAGGWGFVDASGALAIPATYSKAETFVRGLARVYDGRLLRYIDEAGTIVWAQE